MKKGLVDQELNTTCVQSGTVWTVSTKNFGISLLEETLFIFQLSSPVTFVLTCWDRESLKDTPEHGWASTWSIIAAEGNLCAQNENMTKTAKQGPMTQTTQEATNIHTNQNKPTQRETSITAELSLELDYSIILASS